MATLRAIVYCGFYFHAGVEIGKPGRLTGQVISIIKQIYAI